MVLVAIPKHPFYGPPNKFTEFVEAKNALDLPKYACNNIHTCVQGTIGSAYGFIWEDWSVNESRVY
jgi:hypothetical protein